MCPMSQVRVHGVDYIADAVEQACARTMAERERLTFQVGDMNAADFPRQFRRCAIPRYLVL